MKQRQNSSPDLLKGIDFNKSKPVTATRLTAQEINKALIEKARQLQAKMGEQQSEPTESSFSEISEMLKPESAKLGKVRKSGPERQYQRNSNSLSLSPTPQKYSKEPLDQQAQQKKSVVTGQATRLALLAAVFLAVEMGRKLIY